MNDDAELLRQYTAQHSNAAFTALVQRHIGLVYATALRRVGGDRHLAEDVAQSVFVDLARKARTLQDRSTLGGWLYVSTQHAAAAVVRKEQRRKNREVQAMSSTDPVEPTDAEWDKIRPVLDDAMTELRDADREAVVLRFFQARSCAEIAATLRVTEEAARKRVDRALDKLRDALLKRGIVSTSTALGATLSAATVDVPSSLGVSVATHALRNGGSVAASVLVSVTKTLLPIAAAVALGGWLLGHQYAVNAALESRIDRLTLLEPQAARWRTETDVLRRQIAEMDELRQTMHQLPTLRSKLVEKQAAMPSEPTPITVTADGRIQWRDRFVTLDQFLRELKALHASSANHDSAIVVRANGSVFSAFNYVVDEARKTGIQHVAVESDTPADPKVGFSWF